MQSIEAKTELLDRFLGSEMAGKMQNEIDREKLAHRQTCVANIIREKKRLSELPELKEASQKAQEAITRAKQTMQQADIDYRKCIHAERLLTSSLDHAVSRQERQLIQTAPVFINDCIAWISKEHEQLKRVAINEAQRADQEQYDIDKGRMKKQRFSNSPSIQDRARALFQMRRDIDDWRLRAMSLENMELEFDQMKTDLPVIRVEAVGGLQ